MSYHTQTIHVSKGVPHSPPKTTSHVGHICATMEWCKIKWCKCYQLFFEVDECLIKRSNLTVQVVHYSQFAKNIVNMQGMPRIAGVCVDFGGIHFFVNTDSARGFTEGFVDKLILQ